MFSQPANLSPSPTNLSHQIPPSPNPLSVNDLRRMPQSLPATPTSVRTFTDFSGEHKRLTTLHGSTGALEVSNLGGFKLGSAIAMNTGVNGVMNGVGGTLNGVNGGSGNMHVVVGQGSVPVHGAGKFSGAFESSIDGFVKNGAMSTPTTPIPEFVPMGTSNGMRAGVVNGLGHTSSNGVTRTSPPNPFHAPISEVEDEISDVFTALSVKDPMVAAPGYGRGRSRRSSAPVNMSMQQLWGSMGGPGGEQLVGEISNGLGGGGGDTGFGGNSRNNAGTSTTISSFNGWNAPTTLASVSMATAPQSQQTPATVPSIWSGSFQVPTVTSQNSRPNSQTSSYSNSSEQGSSSLSAFSPIYSPTSNSSNNGFFTHEPVSSSTTSTLHVSNPLANSISIATDHQQQQSYSTAFKVCMHTQSLGIHS